MSEPQTDTAPDELQVTVVTPEGCAYEGPAASVVVPAHDGEVAFLKGHAPFLAEIGVGELRVRDSDDAEHCWFLEGGVAQVSGNVVTLLAEGVAPTAEVDVDAARRDLEEANALVPTTDDAFEERDRAQASARARLRLVKD